MKLVMLQTCRFLVTIYQRTFHQGAWVLDGLLRHMCIGTTSAPGDTREHSHMPNRLPQLLRKVGHYVSGLVRCRHHMHHMCMATRGTERDKTSIIERNGKKGVVEHIDTYHSFEGCTISGASEITHCPDCWPHSCDVTNSWELDCCFKVASCEAEFVPIGH